jgi:hypothetical protein
MDEKKPISWSFGFVSGLLVPAVACVVASMLFAGHPSEGLFNVRAGFFGCLLCAAALFCLGVRGWRRWPFSRGLTVGASLWLAGLPFVAGDCTQSGPS